MSEQKVFFSWQSDVKAAACRTIIERALADAVRDIAEDDSIRVEPVIDRDTLGLPGCPDIGTAIFSKVENAAVFVADVTIINSDAQGRKTPNPNVLVELGFALGVLGWERVILVQNTAFGVPEDLPFDLRQKRALTYVSPENADERAPERKKLQATLRDALGAILKIARQPKNPTVIDRLKGISIGTSARLVYLPLNREQYVHDGFKIEVLGVDDAGNVLSINNQTGTPGPPDAIPLGDIEQVWTREGVPFIQVSGFMDHTPLAPYRYRPRAKGATLPAKPTGPHMSEAAHDMLNHIGGLYAEKGFPNHTTWWFAFVEDARIAELRALGLVEMTGTRERSGMCKWRLTDAGQRSAMTLRRPER
jgi:hypothetical protein